MAKRKKKKPESNEVAAVDTVDTHRIASPVAEVATNRENVTPEDPTRETSIARELSMLIRSAANRADALGRYDVGDSLRALV